MTTPLGRSSDLDAVCEGPARTVPRDERDRIMMGCFGRHLDAWLGRIGASEPVEEWTPEWLIQRFRRGGRASPLIGDRVSPCVRISGRRVCRFVAVHLTELDERGHPAAILDKTAAAIGKRLAGGPIPGSVLINTRSIVTIVFLLSRHIVGGKPIRVRKNLQKEDAGGRGGIESQRSEQPVPDPELKGLFSRAALGAAWLVSDALHDLPVQLARQSVVREHDCLGRAEWKKDPDNPGGRPIPSFVCKRTSGLAIYPALLTTPTIPLPGDHVPHHEAIGAEYEILNQDLYAPEELASYAPAPEHALVGDAAWKFVRELRTKAGFEAALQRFESARHDIDSIPDTGKLCPPTPLEDIRQAIETLHDFTREWSTVNDGLVAGNQIPLGYSREPFGLAVHSEDTLTDPAGLFITELRKRLRDGDAHIALKDGAPPHGTGSELNELGWEELPDGRCRGGTPWTPKGPRIGWVDLNNRTLLLDIEELAPAFRERGPKRCVALCAKPSTLARMLATAGVLASSDHSPARLKIEGRERKVYRLELGAIFAYRSGEKRES